MYKFKEIGNESEVKEVTFYLKDLKGLGVFKIDDDVKGDKLDTDNWKKYELSDFQTGLNVIRTFVKKFYTAQAQPTTASEEAAKNQAEEKKGGFKNVKYKDHIADKEFLKSIYKNLLTDLTAATKTIGLKMKDDQLEEFVKTYLEKGEGKYPKNYEEILSNATKELIKRKK